MYTKFYGFSEKPFELTPNPRFLYPTPSHREALDSMIDSIKNRKGLISITGEVGTGKTTLIHTLLNSLDEKVKTVYIFHPTITFNELLETILLELDLEVVERTEAALLFRLVKYSSQLDADETIAIIIDEAQSLPEEVMDKIQIFSGLEPKAIQIVLVGQSEFEDRLSSESLGQLAQKIASKRQIRTLSEEESRDYVDHRLKLVGSSSFEAFTPEATSMICDYARGIPRIINVLCDNAFLTGYSLSQKRIGVGIICNVIKNLEGPFPQQSFPASIAAIVSKFRFSRPRFNSLLRKTSLILLSSLCIGIFILLISQYFPPKNDKTWDVKSLRSPNADTRPSLTSPSQEKQEKNLRTEASSRADTSFGPAQPVTPSFASDPFPNELGKPQKIVTVKKGQTLSSLTQRYYNMVNSTLVALILDFNPEITNADHIKVDQEIKMPKITEELLVIRSTGDTYKLHVGTFQSLGFTRFYRNELALKGKVIEIFPRKVSPQDTWYRVVAGPFGHKDECLKMIDHLKENGLLAVFGGVPKIE